MDIAFTASLTKDIEQLTALTNTLNRLKIGEGIVLKTNNNDLNVRIKNNFSQSLFHSLEQNYLEIQKRPGKGDHYYWLSFQPEITARIANPRHGLHLLGDEGWKFEEFKTFKDQNKLYKGISLPLTNIGPEGMFHLYNHNQ